MTPEQLPAIRTPVSAEDLGLALCTAYRALVGATPSRDAIILLLAHSSLETGRWKSCMCWNLGNVKSRPEDGRSWTFFRCNEIIGGKIVWFDPPHRQSRFRAFHTMTEGAIDHVDFLCHRQRYAKAWAEIMAGRPHEYVQELKAAGYFTAAEKPYENAVVNIFNAFRSQLQFEVPPDEPVIDDETRARTLALVALTINENLTDPSRVTLPDDAVVGDEEVPPTDRNS